MGKNIFEEWDKLVDDDFLENVSNAESNKPPYGVYECTLSDAELKESKAGKPMLAMQFKMVEGKGSIFYNQVIEKPFQIALAVKMLKSLDSDIDVEFKSYSDFAEIVKSVAENVKELGLSFEVDFAKDKEYDKITILSVFEAE